MGDTPLAGSPRKKDSSEDSDEPDAPLGEVLSGRLAGVDIDSVEAVRELREDG